MNKNLFIVFLTIIFSISFCLNSFAKEINTNEVYSISDSSVFFDSDEVQKYKQSLIEQRVDPGKAVILSTLYFGLGQLYAGDTARGAWVLAGGTILTGLLLVIVLPRLKDRQESVKSMASALSYVTLGIFHIWNIRDAYTTAERVNTEIYEKLLISKKIIEQFEKFEISSNNISGDFKINYTLANF